MNAFTISVQDWIRKLGGGYIAPIDFIPNAITSLAYKPGALVNIRLSGEAIHVQTSTTIDDAIFNSVFGKDVFTLGRLVPPVKSYSAIELSSGNKVLRITGEERSVEVETATAPVKGSNLTIHRKGENTGEETARLIELFGDSDLEVILDGEAVTHRDESFEFAVGGFRGRASYNARAEGQLHFYEKGRFVSSRPFVPGVDVYLYEHGLPTTITKSAVITRGIVGKPAFQNLLAFLPGLMTQLLSSPYAQGLRANSEVPYQTLLRTVFSKFKDCSDISDIVKRDIRFADSSGSINPNHTVAYLKANKGLKLSPLEASLFEELTGQKYAMRNSRGSIKRPNWCLRGIAAGATAIILGAAIMGITNAHNTGTSTEANNYALQSNQNADTLAPGFKKMLILNSFRGERSGGGYISNQEIAEILAGGNGANQFSGYNRFGTGNHLFMRDGELYWDNSEPLDQLVSDVQVRMPPQLARLASESTSTSKKVGAVMQYINNNFDYGGIPPESSGQYPDIMTAVEIERRAICSSGNSFAAALLSQLGVTNIRYATGVHGGIPHAWLEEKKGEKWVIRDFTPTSIEKDLLLRLATAGVRDFSGVESTGLLRQTMQEYKRELEFVLTRPDQALGQTGTLLAVISALTLTGAGTYMGVNSLRNRMHRRIPDGTYEPKQAADTSAKVSQLHDLLGANVCIAEGEKIDYINGTVLIPPSMLAESPIIVAARAAELLPKNKLLQAYSRIARTAKR